MHQVIDSKLINVNRLSRRGFLGSTALALASATWMQRLAAEEPQAAGVKVVVGANPWVYAAKQPNCDILPILPEIFSDMRYAGMDGIELMHTCLRPDNAVEQIAELSQKHRLSIIGTSFGGEMWDRAQHQAILEDAELVITRLAKLGGRTLGVSVGYPGKKKTPQQLDDQADLLQKIIAICNANGVTLNLHNHTYEVIDDLYDVKGTTRRIPDVKLGPDLNWLLRGGVDPVAFIREHGNRIVFLHLRDQNADGRWSESLGEGAMDYSAVGKALHDIAYKGPAVIELAHEDHFQPTRPIRESLKMSRAFVRSALGY